MISWGSSMNILSLGEKIKKLRKEKNMTLKELAGDRITAAQISHIERDKSHTSHELLEYLANQLDVSVDYLLETKEMQSKKLTDNLILQSEILIKCNDLEKAENQLKEAIEICDIYKILDNYGKCNFLLADINFKKEIYNESVMSYEKALHCFIKNNDKKNAFKCYLNIGKIYMLMSMLVYSDRMDDYVLQVINYINMSKTNVNEIARNMNVERHYLSRMFKKKMGITIQEYALKKKIEIACRYIEMNMPICEIADLLGYSDQFVFSKIFKKKMGMSPLQYKKQLKITEGT